MTKLPTTLITITGPTSSGKSSLAINLAKQLDDAWVVNADSRQIYKQLNIGTGKEPGNCSLYNNHSAYIVDGIPHTLIDYVDPLIQYSLIDYLQDFKTFCDTVQPKYVIVVGGTGLYIDTINSKKSLQITNSKFQKEAATCKHYLNQLSKQELQNQATLQNVALNQSDFQNPRRLINRLFDKLAQDNGWLEEFILPSFAASYHFMLLPDQNVLESNISKRLNSRYQSGLITEVESLQYLGASRLLTLGLEYRLVQLYLLGQISEDQLLPLLLRHNIRYAKKQKTWLNQHPSTIITSVSEILDQLN